jgi:hypothetical protein
LFKISIFYLSKQLVVNNLTSEPGEIIPKVDLTGEPLVPTTRCKIFIFNKIYIDIFYTKYKVRKYLFYKVFVLSFKHIMFNGIIV